MASKRRGATGPGKNLGGANIKIADDGNGSDLIDRGALRKPACLSALLLVFLEGAR
jgi:hypothetical protein